MILERLNEKTVKVGVRLQSVWRPWIRPDELNCIAPRGLNMTAEEMPERAVGFGPDLSRDGKRGEGSCVSRRP